MIVSLVSEGFVGRDESSWDGPRPRDGTRTRYFSNFEVIKLHFENKHF